METAKKDHQQLLEEQCEKKFPTLSIKELFLYGNGKTLDGDINSPLAKVALIRRLAVKELLSRYAIVESFEQLVNKLASSGDTNAHSFALELLWQRMPALRKEEPEHIPPVLFTILTTVRDRKVTAAVKEILKTYPDDVVRKALAARLDM